VRILTQEPVIREEQNWLTILKNAISDPKLLLKALNLPEDDFEQSIAARKLFSLRVPQPFIDKIEKLYNLLYKLKLRSRGAKIVGLIFSLFKEDFININGLDEKYIGYGYEDDDFGNRFFKYGGETFVFKMKMYPIHMYHKAASPNGSPNEDYYRQRKINHSIIGRKYH